MTLNYLTALFFLVLLGVATLMPDSPVKATMSTPTVMQQTNNGPHKGREKQNGQSGWTPVPVRRASSR